MKQLFELEGKPVHYGDLLHIAPDHHWHAGESGWAERYYGGGVQLRHKNGAVPTVPVDALSWEPHPQTVLMEQMENAGISRPTSRDLQVWRAAIASVHNDEGKGCLQ